MRQLFLIAMVIVSLISFSVLDVSGQGRNASFIGLWKGIDPFDGSDALRSITRNDDGTFYIIGTESYLSGCGGRRGIIVGVGVIEENILVSDQITLICYDPYEETPEIDVEYSIDRINKVLIEKFTGGSFPQLIFHRIDSR